MPGRIVRLLSWNIQWGRGRDGVVDLRRTAEAARAFDPDVLCLQEVAARHPELPGGAPGDQFAQLAGLFLGYEAAAGVACDLPDGQGGRRLFGNLILSRYPIRQVFRHALPFPADPSCPTMPRMALEAVVDSPLGMLRVIATHLEYYSPIQRAAQVGALRGIHAEGWGHVQTPCVAGDADPPFAVLPRGEFTVLCGDFNCPPQAPELETLATAVPPAPTLRDAWRVARPGQPHAPTAGAIPSAYFEAPVCYDFCFVSENLVPYLEHVDVDGACAASDHQPLFVDFLPEGTAQ